MPYHVHNDSLETECNLSYMFRYEREIYSTGYRVYKWMHTDGTWRIAIMSIASGLYKVRVNQHSARSVSPHHNVTSLLYYSQPAKFGSCFYSLVNSVWYWTEPLRQTVRLFSVRRAFVYVPTGHRWFQTSLWNVWNNIPNNIPIDWLL